MEGFAKRICEARFLQVYDVLKDVITEGILDKMERVFGDLLYQMRPLVANGMIDAALKDTATVAMGTNSNAVSANRAEYELGHVSVLTNKVSTLTYLSILCIELVKALLDDMIAIEVLNQLHDLVI